MDNIKLPSMLEYVKSLDVSTNTETDTQTLYRLFNFANFLSQQPNIGMFVPAVEKKGKCRILTKPISPWQDSIIEEGLHQMHKEDLYQYQTALDNVIFEGFEYDGSEDGFVHIKNNETLLVFDAENKELVLYNSENNYTTEIKTIEDLIPYSLTLTPKFAKELGL